MINVPSILTMAHDESGVVGFPIMKPEEPERNPWQNDEYIMTCCLQWRGSFCKAGTNH